MLPCGSRRTFFEKLGDEGRRRIEAVAMDMNGAYEAEVKAQCPRAKIVYDQFHVVAKYGREVIDATVGGKLEVFPKVSYDALFNS